MDNTQRIMQRILKSSQSTRKLQRAILDSPVGSHSSIYTVISHYALFIACNILTDVT